MCDLTTYIRYERSQQNCSEIIQQQGICGLDALTGTKMLFACPEDQAF